MRRIDVMLSHAVRSTLRLDDDADGVELVDVNASEIDDQQLSFKDGSFSMRLLAQCNPKQPKYTLKDLL